MDLQIMITVIDAGIIMNTSLVPELVGDIVMPRSVMNEIKSQQASHLLEMIRSEHKLAIVDPQPQYLREVEEIAQNMGQNNLSSQDKDVLAVALDYQNHGKVKIYSDDYGIRNVAHQLKIESTGVTTTGGEQKRRYKYQCKACGKFYQEVMDDCDICGHTEFKRYRR